MSFDEFDARLLTAMQDRFPGLEFEREYIRKLQGLSYNGLVIREKNGSIGMTVDLDFLYRQLENGKPFAGLLSELQESVLHADMPVNETTVESLRDYGNLRENLILQIVPVEKNRELLNDVPHKRMGDLAVVYRILLRLDEQGEAGILLTGSSLQTYGITLEQLESDAYGICEQKHPLTIRSMENTLFGTPEEEVHEPGLWVISNDTGRYGAAVISYPGALEKIAGRLGSGYYLIPSSIHEFLAVPDSLNMKAADIDRMVAGVNSSEVAPEEQLSDHCYHYDKDAGLFESGAEYEERTGSDVSSGFPHFIL